MKQWTTTLLVALFSITLIAGCGGGNGIGDGTPEGDVKQVVSNMFEATKQMDFDALGKCLVPAEAKKIEMMKGMMKMIPAEKMEEMKAELATAKMTFGEVKIDGDTATCVMTVTGMAEGEEKEQTDTMNLKKIDGKWYLASMPK